MAEPTRGNTTKKKHLENEVLFPMTLTIRWSKNSRGRVP